MNIEASLAPWVVGGVVLGILKHQGVLDLSWWLVFGVAFLPIWVGLAALVVVGAVALLCLVLAGILWVIDSKERDY